MRPPRPFNIAALSVLLSATAVLSAPPGDDLRFSFNGPRPGFTAVSPGIPYDEGKGFGFLSDGVFAVDVPEGNYDVTVTFGDGASATSTTLKAESRRLMIERVETTPGQFVTREFTINVRRPEIRTGGKVVLTAREKGPPAVQDWDDHLSFEFLGSHPGAASLQIKPAPNAITVYLAGDSTVTDPAAEPWSSWGQMLPRFFGPGAAVADHAESGLALYSFQSERRLEKILSIIKPGDYLFIQFGHNDQKNKAPGAGPFTTYKEQLKQYIEAARAKGATVVVVTSMERRRWLGDQFQPTLSDFAEAARQAAAEEKAPLIDLNAMSMKFYTALGPENSTKAFVHYPANTFPGQDKPLKDDTHHNAYGGYELARCVVEGIKVKAPELARYLRNDVGPFDPSKPDSPEKIDIPRSKNVVVEKPAGS